MGYSCDDSQSSLLTSCSPFISVLELWIEAGHVVSTAVNCLRPLNSTPKTAHQARFRGASCQG